MPSVAYSRSDSRRALEKERDRHLQDLRDLLKAARADTVSALLVFLNLLERQAESVAELLLAHPQHHAAHAHAAADMLVDRVRRLLGHHKTELLCLTYLP
jgi:cellobiose-specific phosphotransferase system component IIA